MAEKEERIFIGVGNEKKSQIRCVPISREEAVCKIAEAMLMYQQKVNKDYLLNYGALANVALNTLLGAVK